MEKVDTSSNPDDPALFFIQCPAPAASGQSRIASPLSPQNLVPQLLLSPSIPTALRRKKHQSHLASSTRDYLSYSTSLRSTTLPWVAN